MEITPDTKSAESPQPRDQLFPRSLVQLLRKHLHDPNAGAAANTFDNGGVGAWVKGDGSLIPARWPAPGRTWTA